MRTITIASVVSLGILAAACAGHGPTAPTASSAPATASRPAPGGISTGATIAGTVVGVGSTSAVRTMGGGLSVTVSGTSSASSVDGAGHFTLQNVPSGQVDLHFMGAGVDAHLVLDGVTEHQTITITVRVSGSSAELEEHEREDPEHNAEVEGLVTAIGAGSLTVGGKTVTVTASTKIVHGDTPLTLADIHIGDRVHVHGTAAAATGTTPIAAAIVATKIEVQSGQETPGKGGEHVELHGTIAAGSLSGSCAAHTRAFGVGTTKVTTNAATEFRNVACEGLSAGTEVEVKGARQADGSVLASRVVAKNEGHDDSPAAGAGVEVSGTVSDKGGTCPALTFKLGGVAVATSATTEFKNVTCSALANGDRVEVKGTKQSTVTILASRVEKKK